MKDYSPESANIVMQRVVDQRVRLGVITEAEGTLLKTAPFQLLKHVISNFKMAMYLLMQIVLGGLFQESTIGL